jgi:hypothetical protein
MMLSLCIGAAVVVGVLWTCLIGGYLHWIPILAAIVTILIIAKNTSDKKD